MRRWPLAYEDASCASGVADDPSLSLTWCAACPLTARLRPRVAAPASGCGSILRHAVPVILEHALLPVKPGEEADFESAFAEAKVIIAAMPGFLRLTLSRCLEHPNTYLLLVEWDRLVDHTEGFRGSPQYQEWRRLLHSFYEPFPVVEHYEQVHSA
jgi:heme-degrading monooxygenase HmoA